MGDNKNKASSSYSLVLCMCIILSTSMVIYFFHMCILVSLFFFHVFSGLLLAVAYLDREKKIGLSEGNAVSLNLGGLALSSYDL